MNADIADAPPIAADRPREWMDDLTAHIIGAAYKVSSTLGNGFLEKVCENALALELEAGGLRARKQQTVKVRYRGEVVGNYLTDLLVEDSVVVEIKAVDAYCSTSAARGWSCGASSGISSCTAAIGGASAESAFLISSGPSMLPCGRSR